MNDYKEFIFQVNKIVKKQEKERKLEIKRQDVQIKRAIALALKTNYNNWRKEVFKRDNYTCIICGKDLSKGNPKNMQPHHILAKETYPELKTCVENGITVCYYDHKNSKQSPHLNALAFVETILKVKRPEQYEFLVNYLKNKTILLTSK